MSHPKANPDLSAYNPTVEQENALLRSKLLEARAENDVLRDDLNAYREEIRHLRTGNPIKRLSVDVPTEQKSPEFNPPGWRNLPTGPGWRGGASGRPERSDNSYLESIMSEAKLTNSLLSRLCDMVQELPGVKPWGI